jgi:hypothetical protein
MERLEERFEIAARHQLGIGHEATEQELVGHAFGDRLIDATAAEVDVDARTCPLDGEHTRLLLHVEELQHFGKRHDAQIAAQPRHAFAEQAQIDRRDHSLQRRVVERTAKRICDRCGIGRDLRTVIAAGFRQLEERSDARADRVGDLPAQMLDRACLRMRAIGIVGRREIFSGDQRGVVLVDAGPAVLADRVLDDRGDRLGRERLGDVIDDPHHLHEPLADLIALGGHQDHGDVS